MSKKIILHLCADIGSDSYYFQQDPDYEVVLIGEKIGVENVKDYGKVHGIISNPVCTEFSNAKRFDIPRDYEKGMFLVSHCLRIIKECTPDWWVMENPSTGALRKYIGNPKHTYHPWQYGSPWTKGTGLWGEFNMPNKKITNRKNVIKNPNLYVKPGGTLPEFTALHKSAIDYIPEFEKFKPFIKTDADFRSLCSQGFAKAFYEANRTVTQTSTRCAS